MYKTRQEEKDRKRENVEFIMDDLLNLSELRPPSFMPNGNIGTSLTTFMSLIRACQLPPIVIKKLGLSFPSSRSKHCYGNVRFDYANDANEEGISLCLGDDSIKGSAKEGNQEVEEILLDGTSNDCNLLGPSLINSNESSNDENRCMQNINDSSPNNMQDKANNETNSNQTNIKADDGETSSDTESEPEEDWERHEALHDDVDCQGRTKERLFENEIELKWEKGGSGLVFYTDAAYWDSLSGDFDEQAADDWDIDMSIYEKGGRYILRLSPPLPKLCSSLPPSH